MWRRARPEPRQEGVTARSFPPQLRARPGRDGAVMSASALPPSPAFPSATTRAFVLRFPDPSGLKHVELNIHPARCSRARPAPEIDLWEPVCSFCHPTRRICVSVVTERNTCWENARACTQSQNPARLCAPPAVRDQRRGWGKGSWNRECTLGGGSDCSLLATQNLLSFQRRVRSSHSGAGAGVGAGRMGW